MLPKTLEELDKVRDECKSMVTRRATASGAAAAVPVPAADVAADVGLLLELIPAINKKFGLTDEQIESLDMNTKAIIYSITKKVGTELIGRAITKKLVTAVLRKIGIRVAAKSVVKFVPIIGQVAAAGISFAAMKKVGNAHVDDCYEIVKKYLESNKETD
ncbi:hypothetical protein SD71_14095 [Cohnella kolymensis]|uniref:DUF697 domain-containing protein n=1 Tax=Cohnella kolymensis TaxID=1590652 RepID=A0ABR5A2Z1_9BACL|nr:hypothetical protein [Cohnella kolymensis]KIL35426.1 hypothetical protein SD71_14095 [Cohnella kolymensis]